MGRPYPVAASAAVELTLVGPARPATVVATTSHAVYLAVDDGLETMVCLAAASAVRVPCALLLESKALPPQPPIGTTATVGDGTLWLDNAAFRVTRWWRPSRPRGLGAIAPARVTAAVRWLTGRVADPLDGPGRAAVADLVLALSTGDPVDAAVARLLGRGPGLTPTGDDVLAGAMVSLNALGAPAASALSEAVLAAAPRATTVVSVALLRHAARGECIPQVADLLTAVAHGDPPPSRAAGALLAVGHCSGAGLLHGVLVGLAIAHRRIASELFPAVTSARPATPAALPVPVPAVLPAVVPAVVPAAVPVALAVVVAA